MMRSPPVRSLSTYAALYQPLLEPDDPYRLVADDYSDGSELGAAATRSVVYAHRLDRSPADVLAEPVARTIQSIWRAKAPRAKWHPAVVWAKKQTGHAEPPPPRRPEPPPPPERRPAAVPLPVPGWYDVVECDGELRAIPSWLLPRGS